MSKTHDIAIIGGGLSGLACAWRLHQAGRDVIVLEAADRPGGRIRSVLDEAGDCIADLGPSWVWPAFQPVIRQWLDELNLPTMPQFADGQTLVDYGPDQKAQAAFIPLQEGNERVIGGSEAMIWALAAGLPGEMIETNTRVTSVAVEGDKLAFTTNNEVIPSVTAHHGIVALPPRLAAETIKWPQGISRDVIDMLRDTPTWMAPHAKVAILYETAFWREWGLSGRIVSRGGPIVECHDHCGPHGSPAALWGFIGWPHAVREKARDSLEPEIRVQLRRCFGEDSPEPFAVHIMDWAGDENVTTALDRSGAMNHPEVRPDLLRAPHLDGRLFFAGSETAMRSPGLIEGAFDAAERASALILKA